MLRQDAAAASGSALGVSSFAFQGTNAHVVLAPAGVAVAATVAASGGLPAALWRRQRFWYSGAPHAMLTRCSASPVASMVRMQCQLSHNTSLAYLRDHCIQGRVLFPAAAMLEMCLAGAGAALEPLAGGGPLVLSGVAIAAPLVLPAQSAAVRAPVQVVSLSLHYATGALVVQSSQNSIGGSFSMADTSWTRHMAARAGCLAPTGIASGKAGKLSGSLQQRMYAAFVASATVAIGAAGLLPGGGSQSPQLPVATGQVVGGELLSTQQPEGYIMHPALLDAATHTAAALQASHAEEARVTRIPVALGALVAAADNAAAASAASPPLLHDAAQWAAGVFGGLSADGSTASTSFSLTGRSALQLSGFQAKTVSAAGLHGPATGPTAASAPARRTAAPAAASRPTPVAARPKVDAAAIESQVLRIVSKMLGGMSVAPDQPLMEAGLDSLGAVELRTALNAAFSMELPATGGSRLLG